ncbi:MAG: (Fe-S)-binding protein [Gammaproteobacteria bacterium]|nr:(Fe-S)-binding protein [Gammaproteobacteria bacterium]MDH5692119.1 (Fe-S)-binding protein [Gammaproteobacteria bacterium]
MNRPDLPVSYAQDPKKRALSDIDLCVMCGLCSNTCPTYQAHRTEQESPRGRIALAKWILNEVGDLSQAAIDSLTNCLGCRECEKSCPSLVPYHKIWSTAVAAVRQRQPHLLRKKNLLSSTSEWGKGLVSMYQLSGAQWLARKTKAVELLGLGHADRAIPQRKGLPALAPSNPAHVTERGIVGFFVGCLSNSFDSESAHALVRVYNRLGYRVEITKGQACCGAPLLQQGQAGEFQLRAMKNIHAFMEPSTRFQVVVGLNSGCMATLRSYYDSCIHSYQQDALSKRAINRFHLKLTDAVDFLNRFLHWSQHSVNRLNKRVVVHQPCTSRNALRQQEASEQLLRRIPELEILRPKASYVCCGAAGLRMLKPDQTQIALQHRAVDSILASEPDIIVSTNIGCSMFLGSRLKELGKNIEIIHPITLLNRQLV